MQGHQATSMQCLLMAPPTYQAAVLDLLCLQVLELALALLAKASKVEKVAAYSGAGQVSHSC